MKNFFTLCLFPTLTLIPLLSFAQPTTPTEPILRCTYTVERSVLIASAKLFQLHYSQVFPEHRCRVKALRQKPISQDYPLSSFYLGNGLNTDFTITDFYIESITPTAITNIWNEQHPYYNPGITYKVLCRKKGERKRFRIRAPGGSVTTRGFDHKCKFVSQSKASKEKKIAKPRL